MAVRAASASPDALGADVIKMIQRLAPRARRAHDDLVLPDASGTPVSLKSLFDSPRDLMAALIRGGWIIPGEPDRSMFLSAIIGTGPMMDTLSQADVDLLSDWVTAGAPIPPAGANGLGLIPPHKGGGIKRDGAVYLGRSVFPIRNVSIARAQRRPSRIAQTTSDWPRRMSPAENTLGREVW